MEDDLNATARDFYLAKTANGAVPEVWSGGLLDGLCYFPITIDDIEYFLTKDGLFTPPEEP